MMKRTAIAAVLCLWSIGGWAGDVEDLASLLDDFLAHADEAPAHERFWADDLVYTSSAGTRTNKADIMASFQAPDPAEEASDSPGYRAEDVDIRLYGDTAIVAFRLVATARSDAGEIAEQHYFNTGTFLKRQGTWQVVAWQATRIPGPD